MTNSKWKLIFASSLIVVLGFISGQPTVVATGLNSIVLGLENVGEAND